MLAYEKLFATSTGRLEGDSDHGRRLLLPLPVRAPHVDQQGQGEELQATIRGTRDPKAAHDRRSDVCQLQSPGAAGIERDVRSPLSSGGRGHGRNGRATEAAGEGSRGFGECRGKSKSSKKQSELFDTRVGIVRGCVSQVASLITVYLYYYMLYIFSLCSLSYTCYFIYGCC